MKPTKLEIGITVILTSLLLVVLWNTKDDGVLFPSQVDVPIGGEDGDQDGDSQGEEVPKMPKEKFEKRTTRTITFEGDEPGTEVMRVYQKDIFYKVGKKWFERIPAQKTQPPYTGDTTASTTSFFQGAKDLFASLKIPIALGAVESSSTTKDTYVRSSQSGTNFGSVAYIHTGGWGDTYHGLLEWDLTGLPTADETSNVDMCLTVQSVNVQDAQLWIYRVTSSWVEGSVTWNNRPSHVTTDGVDVPNLVGKTDGYVECLDITTFYDGWEAETFSNYGVYIYTTYTTQSQTYFRSSDYSVVSTHPYLEITYTPEEVPENSTLPVMKFKDGVGFSGDLMLY